MTELEADADAREFCAVNGVGGGSGGHLNFDVGVRGRVDCGSSEWGGASLFGAVHVDEVMLALGNGGAVVGQYEMK
jgi:hypothetical protein